MGFFSSDSSSKPVKVKARPPHVQPRPFADARPIGVVARRPAGHPAPGPGRKAPAPAGAEQPILSAIGPLRATTAVVSGRCSSKVDLYANSRLGLALPPFVPPRRSGWPQLVRLAAQCSLRAYSPPTGPQGSHQALFVSPDRRSGSKAIYISFVSDGAARTVVVAIRGTASLADWAVNLRTEPASPLGFLDDAGNACHAGYLSVARAMVAPIARHLREMLQGRPSHATDSLVLTGYSAGGAVAALL